METRCKIQHLNMYDTVPWAPKSNIAENGE